MIKAKLKLPKLTTKKVWAGTYGGHYDQIVFFKSKPTPSKERHNFINGEWYDCLGDDNKDLIIGDCGLGQFKELFPDADINQYLNNGRPKAIDITEVFEIELTAMFNKYGKLESISFNQDW